MSAHRTALPARVERRNAVFQHWESPLTNRTQRTRARELIVQGVRPITQALEHGVPVTAPLSDGRDRRSRWAQDVLDQHGGPVVRVAPEPLAELGEREDGAPEPLALVESLADDLSRIPRDGAPVVVVFDRPAGPGNIGSLARSVDALGGGGLVTTGHSADAWDPASVRASTGSVFAVPVVRQDSVREVLSWARGAEHGGAPFTVIGTDEHGDVTPPGAPIEGPVLFVIGAERTGMSAAWREGRDVVASIPMAGSASSLNAAAAGSIVLYEAPRRREEAS